VQEQMIGTQATVTMGDLRSIRCSCLETRRPASYTVSGLATVTNALFAAAVKTIGSCATSS
jgi:hypothetical protein